MSLDIGNMSLNQLLDYQQELNNIQKDISNRINLLSGEYDNYNKNSYTLECLNGNDSIYHFNNLSIHIRIDKSKQITIWTSFNDESWLKLYQHKMHCQGCQENQLNQLAHPCLDDIILYDDDFDKKTLLNAGAKLNLNERELINLLEKLINHK